MEQTRKVGVERCKCIDNIRRMAASKEYKIPYDVAESSPPR